MTCESLATKADIQAIAARLTSIETKIDNLSNLVTAAKDAIIDAIGDIETIVNAAVTLIQSVLTFLQNDILAAIAGVTSLLNNVFDTIQASIAALVAIVQSLFGGGGGEEIDYSRIEQMLSIVREQIISHINNKFDSLLGEIVENYQLVINAINGLYSGIGDLIEGAKSAILAAIENKINWLHERLLELFHIVSLSFTALYNNIRDLINALQLDGIDYERIENAINSIKIQILDRIAQAEAVILAAIAALGLLTLLDTIGNKLSQILTLLEGLNNILEILNNLRDLFDSNSGECAAAIEQTKIELNGTILSQHILTRNTTLSLQSSFNQQSTEINSQFQSVSASIANVSASIETVTTNIENIEGEPIDYDRIGVMISNAKDFIVNHIDQAIQFLIDYMTEKFSEVIGFIDSKLGSGATTHIGTCAEGSYIDVATESSTVFDSIEALSNQVRAFQAGNCQLQDAGNEVVVGLIANEKTALRITGEQLVLHFVTEENYPKRRSGSYYRPIQIGAPKPEYDWGTHFENMRWMAGNQYAELRLVGWKNPISGWFASKDAANAFFTYLTDYIIDPSVEVDNIVIPDHSNPKTNITAQIWRPYRAFIMSAPNGENQTTCLQKYYPGQSS